MSRIKGRDTKPELKVRSWLHRNGYRFRLHRRDLPGTPDIVLPRYRAVIFVHGCFWHRHPGCRYAYEPKSRMDFWQEKFRRTIERDRKKASLLRKLGWEVLTIWECEILDESALKTIRKRLDAGRDSNRVKKDEGN